MTQDKQHRMTCTAISMRVVNLMRVYSSNPAATVVLLRDSEESYELLMLKKNSKITLRDGLP